jgi:hypothetical protein
MPACVMRIVTGLVEPSTAEISAPDDVKVICSVIANGNLMAALTCRRSHTEKRNAGSILPRPRPMLRK